MLNKIASLFQRRSAPQETSPIPFGYKNAWIALRSTDSSAVAQALSIRSQVPANWETGIESSYPLEAGRVKSNSVFICPPVEGWILAVSLTAFGEWESTENRISLLSLHFTEVQAFATHRVVEYHHWIRARSGHIERSFAYLGEQGEVQRNFGEITQAERALSFWGEPEDSWLPDERDVMQVASGWSIDPTQLSESSAVPAMGFLGQIT